MVKVVAHRQPVLSTSLRERLELSRSEWARALSVNERTVARWEDEGNDPGGVAMAVMHGLTNALNHGADLDRVKTLIGMGLSTLLYELLRGL